MEISATELKQRTGQVLDEAQRGPVKIMKYGRVYGAVISKQDFELLQAYKKSVLKEKVASRLNQIKESDSSSQVVEEIFQEAIKPHNL